MEWDGVSHAGGGAGEGRGREGKGGEIHLMCDLLHTCTCTKASSEVLFHHLATYFKGSEVMLNYKVRQA